jgi:hypothetical protein
MNIFRWLRELFRQSPRGQAKQQYRTKHVEELPEHLAAENLYLVGTPVWSAALACPCKCGANIHLSLLPDDRPHWRVRANWRGVPTVFPSIWRTSGCRAHFFLRHGIIYWVQETFQPH